MRALETYRARLAALLYALPLPQAQAQSQEHDAPLSMLAPVQTTAARVSPTGFDVPAALTRLELDADAELRARLQLADALVAVPGLLVRDRQNLAQDVQLSIRGFGARASFGIRGVRLIVDGIPATMPDGQGQVSHLAMGAVESIEVLRGPFSALYGNASGGVIQVQTEDGRGPARLSLGAMAGSDGLLQLNSRVSGESGGLGYVIDASRFASDGFRTHSAARRGLGNVKLTLGSDRTGRLTLVGNGLDMPEAQDPLGQTRAQFDADARSVDAAALNFNTRKKVSQSQLGLLYEQRVDAFQTLRLMAYGGQRHTEQFQAIPVAAQASPRHPGGVIDLRRDYAGGDLRWIRRGAVAGRPLTLGLGLAADRLNEQRRGYLNHVAGVQGLRGELRRDERNRVANLDPYLQLSWQAAPDWRLDAGLRRSRLSFNSRDHYIVGSNGDDGGRKTFTATLPMLALSWRASDALRLHASASRGAETPTLNELAYQPDGRPGLNLGLEASRSRNLESGLKARPMGLGELGAALFRTRTNDELVTQANVGGRASFRNGGRTQRQGLELAWVLKPAPHWQGQLAYIWLDARYLDGFAICGAPPCVLPTLQVAAGNRMPGLARSQLALGLSHLPPSGWQFGMAWRGLSRVMADDLNLSAAAGHATADLSLGHAAQLGAWDLRSSMQISNVLDRRYVGSVIVNEGNHRYYEAAAGRSWLLGVSATLRF